MTLHRLFVASTATALVSGCSVFSGSTFNCPADQTGVACMSAREVYSATHVRDRVPPNFRDGKPVAEQDNDGRSSSESERGSEASQKAKPAPQSDGYRPPMPELDAPLPVRTPAKVMRIRIFPWEDGSKDLNSGGLVFTEVEGRTWSLGEEQVARVRANVISPLSAPGRSRSSSAAPLEANVPVSGMPGSTLMPAQQQAQGRSAGAPSAPAHQQGSSPMPAGRAR